MEELIKKDNYDDLYNEVLESMRKKAKKVYFKSLNKYSHHLDTSPEKISHHPLLLDFDWIYQNVENIFFDHRLDYQQFQGFKEYYFFFKVLTKKYSLEIDYQGYYNGKYDIRYLKFKWQNFAYNLADFFSIAPQDVLEKLFLQEDFREYFIRYAELFNDELMLEKFPNFILKYYPYKTLYENNATSLLKFLERYPKVVLPIDVFLNGSLIKAISHNVDTDIFYYNLYILGHDYVHIPYIDEHQRFIAKQIEGIKNGILPYFQDAYEKANDYCYYGNNHNYDKYDNKIFDSIEDLPMPKLEYYQKLSKYYLIELVISSLFETAYYNLLVDMETLVIYVKENRKEIQGFSYYKFLINIENESLEDIIKFYQQVKDLNLKEIFYDDWNSQKEDLIQELNANILDPKTLEIRYRDGIAYYDITNIDKYLIIHAELDVKIHDIDFFKKLKELKEEIISPKKAYISLSIQDKAHQSSYNDCYGAFITLVYGPLKPERVGTIYHEDAYTEGLQNVDIENSEFIRRIYTLEDLMAETYNFNELVYAINRTPFYPIGILANEVTPLIKEASNILELPIFFRDPTMSKEKRVKTYNPNRIRKRYKN